MDRHPTLHVSDQASSVVSTSPSSRVDFTLAEILYRSLTPVTVGLAVLYVIYAATHLFVLSINVASIMSAVAAGTVAVLILLFVLLRKGRVPVKWSHGIGAGIAGLVLINCLLHLYLVPDPRNTTNIALLIIGVGILFLSVGWLLFVVAVALAGWLLVVLTWGFSSEWTHYAFLLVAATCLSFIAFAVRLRLLRGIESLKSTVEESQRRIQAEEAQRESEAKFRILAEHSPNMIFINKGGRVVYANKIAEEQMGYSREELYSKDFDYLSLIAPESIDSVRKSFERHMQGHEVSPYEYRLLTRDGRYLEAIITSRLIDYEGERAILGVVTDVTERKRLERELGQAQKMEAVGQLAAGIAHDFNNLLTVIRGYADVALQDLTSRNPLRPALEKIDWAAERGAALTRQLLAFSRQQMLQPRSLDLNRVVSEMQSELRELAGEDILLVTRLALDLPRVEADPSQLTQVVLNLTKNARDAMPYGGRLSIETSNVTISEAGGENRPGLPAGRYVRLLVRDTGSGVDPEIRGRIFEPFFTTKEAGKGLGLAAVYGIIKQSGGFIYLDSKPGEGSTFEILLPCAGSSSTTELEPPA